MLARRIIPVVLMRGGQAVKGKQFQSWRGVGQVAMTVRVHETRNVDELILLDISGRLPDRRLLSSLADYCFFPLAVGGGIRTSDDASRLLQCGADKVVLNTAAFTDPEVVTRIASKLGCQSVCVSIDARDGNAWTHGASQDTGYKVEAWAKRVEALGAGEILINDISRDGTLDGYNLDLIDRVARSVSVPVIACGGASGYADFAAALRCGAHAVAAGALWQWTDSTPSAAAAYLDRQGFPVRRVQKMEVCERV